MSHEMMENDSAVYFKNPAWHGLGKTVEDAITVSEAMDMAELNWEVDKWPLFTANGIQAHDYRGVMRTDTKEIIGVVSPRYQPVQNWEAFNLAKYFGSDVKVESAGSIRNGRNVYLLLRGETFDAVPNDTVHKYMALFWGHDGSASLTVLPTSVRVVCKNTLAMVMGQARGTSNKISISHNGDIAEKMRAAEEAVKKFKETGKLFESKVKYMATSNPRREDISQFFMNVYANLNKVAVVTNPSTEKEEEVYTKALTTISKWTETFELESQDFGNWSYWTAANAVTNDIQHRVAARGKKKSPASSAYSNLIGQNATDTNKVFAMALAEV